MGISKKIIAISSLTIAAGAPFASAQGNANNLNTFALDLHNNTVVVHQAIAPQADRTSNQILDLSQNTTVGNSMFPAGIQFLIPASGPQEGGFNPSASTISHNQYGSVGITKADAVTKPDILFIVPLPPAAFAGLGLLCGIAGVRTLKSRR